MSKGALATLLWTKDSCESCRKHAAKETLKHNGRALRVCGRCAKSIKLRRNKS